MPIKWLSNISNKDVLAGKGAWLNGKIIGDPKPTSIGTVECLKAMGMMGVYQQVGEVQSRGRG